MHSPAARDTQADGREDMDTEQLITRVLCYSGLVMACMGVYNVS